MMGEINEHKTITVVYWSRSYSAEETDGWAYEIRRAGRVVDSGALDGDQDASPSDLWSQLSSEPMPTWTYSDHEGGFYRFVQEVQS